MVAAQASLDRICVKFDARKRTRDAVRPLSVPRTVSRR